MGRIRANGDDNKAAVEVGIDLLLSSFIFWYVPDLFRDVFQWDNESRSERD